MNCTDYILQANPNLTYKGTEEEGIEEFQVNVHESAKGLLQMVLIICLHMIT
jgi:hypothetical protein